MAEGTGLLNRNTGNCVVSSNLTLSANLGGVAHLVERNFAKVKAIGSKPITRSKHSFINHEDDKWQML